MKRKKVLAALMVCSSFAPALAQSQGGSSSTTQTGYPAQGTTITRRAVSVGGVTLRRPAAPPRYYRAPTADHQAQAAAANYAHQTGVSTYNATQPGVNTVTRTGSVSGSARSAASGAALKTVLRSRDYRDSILIGGVPRTFHVHLPAPSHDKTDPVPLVFVFHGLGMTGDQMVFMSNMSDYGDKNGFAVVYPDGLGRRWNPGAADLEFVEAVIDKLVRTANVDRRRVYAAGISNGGHFVQYLACACDRIAGIAVVAASMLSASGGSNNAVPAILFMGTDDPLVPSLDPDHNAELGKLGDTLGLGGLGSLPASYAKLGGMMTAEETVDFWCRHNNCSGSGATVQMPDRAPNDGTKVTRTSFGAGRNEVVYYRIQGGGHSWPGSFWSGAAKDILGRTSEDITASQLIADFFMSH